MHSFKLSDIVRHNVFSDPEVSTMSAKDMGRDCTSPSLETRKWWTQSYAVWTYLLQRYSYEDKLIFECKMFVSEDIWQIYRSLPKNASENKFYAPFTQIWTQLPVLDLKSDSATKQNVLHFQIHKLMEIWKPNEIWQDAII